jgi:hypothetical protein
VASDTHATQIVGWVARGQAERNRRPLGLATLRRHAGQVEEVPRSSTSRTMIPACSALSQRLHKVGAAPLPQPPVLHPARILRCDAVGVAHDEGPDLMLDGEGDDLLGGLMVGVVDAAAMASFGTPQAGSVAAPATRPALPRRGRPPGGLGLAGLLIGTVQVALGADGSP